MKIRERIRTLVQFRLDAVHGLEEALRRALAVMAQPQNAVSFPVWALTQTVTVEAMARARANRSRDAPRLRANP